VTCDASKNVRSAKALVTCDCAPLTVDTVIYLDHARTIVSHGSSWLELRVRLHGMHLHKSVLIEVLADVFEDMRLEMEYG
jgi:hypothetical protein